MNGIETLYASPAVQATAQTLVHFLWQGALVGIAAAGALTLFKKEAASARYIVALGSLVVLLACPVVTLLWIAGSTGAAADSVEVGMGPALARAEVRSPAATAAATFSAPVLRDALPAAFPWIFGIWLAGVVVLSVYHLGGWRLTWSLRHRGTRPLSGELEARIRELARRMGIRRAVGLLESYALTVPAVIGWLKPVVLVPASTLAGLSPRQLEAVLAHELAHIRRHDYLVNLLQTVVETLLFYHPAVWWISTKIRRERENCCDDLAVTICGDRLGYARTLADLESLRARSPRLAMAADGGSLAERIRRLVGAPSRGSRRSWLVGVLALSLLPTGITFNLLRASDAMDGEALPSAAAPASAPSRQETDRRGTWSAERKAKGEIWLEMRMRSAEDNWSSSSDYAESAFQGLGAGPEVRFQLRRDAGTFHFQGRFEGQLGTGFFTFEGNPTYAREMETLGHKVSESRLLELALHDVSLDFVRQMRDLGYGKASLDRLVEFRIHEVTPEFVRELQGLGYRDLDSEKLVEFRIHEVTPGFIREVQELGYRGLDPEKLVEFRIHEVTPELIREVQGLGYREIDSEDLVDFRIHEVTPEFIQEARSRGYKNLSAKDLVELKIQGRLER